VIICPVLAIQCRSHSVSAILSNRAFALFARAASLQATSVRLRAGDQPQQGQYANDSHHLALGGEAPEQSGGRMLACRERDGIGRRSYL
jgi:hypothetical protein